VGWALLCVTAAISAQPDEAVDPAAETAAVAFLDLFDASEWQAAYDSGDFTFDFPLFEEAIVKHRKERGDLLSRHKLESIPRLAMILGDESAKRAHIVFHSTFANGTWKETVMLVTKGGGPWKVDGYTIGRFDPDN